MTTREWFQNEIEEHSRGDNLCKKSISAGSSRFSQQHFPCPLAEQFSATCCGCIQLLQFVFGHSRACQLVPDSSPFGPVKPLEADAVCVAGEVHFAFRNAVCIRLRRVDVCKRMAPKLLIAGTLTYVYVLDSNSTLEGVECHHFHVRSTSHGFCSCCCFCRCSLVSLARLTPRCRGVAIPPFRNLRASGLAAYRSEPKRIA